MQQVPAELAAAVEGLYAAFAAHPLRVWTEPCLHCVTREQEFALHAAPLRDLPADVVRPYAAHAMTTWGDEREFLHFLPRVLEIAVTGGFGWPDLQVLFAGLRRAGWHTWPRGERAAVEAFLLALWRSTLASFPSLHTAEDVLCAIAQAADDMTPYLDMWAADRGEAASRHLVEIVLWSWQSERARLPSPWWDDREPQHDAVSGWLRTAGVNRLARLADTADDGLLAADAFAAVQVLSAGGAAAP